MKNKFRGNPMPKAENDRGCRTCQIRQVLGKKPAIFATLLQHIIGF
jgi:hypothetical protein